MAPFSPIPRRHPIRVVLSSTALLPFMSVRKAAALATAQLGIAAFFISSIARATVGASAGWFVLGATILTAFARAVDIESWALLIPGGLVSRVGTVFGPRASALAKAATLVERILLAALASVVVGHYVASVSATAIGGLRFTGYVRPEDLATPVAIGAIGVLWLRIRMGRPLARDRMARAIWIGIGILVFTMLWGVITLAVHHVAPSALVSAVPTTDITGWRPADVVLAFVLGFAVTLPMIGAGETLARAAHELPPPRVQALRRTALVSVLFMVVTATVGTFLVLLLVPASEQTLWVNAPLAGLAQYLAGPSSVRALMALAVASAAVLILVPALHAALADAEQMLHRFSADGTLPSGLASLHARFGTPTRAVDVTIAATTFVVVASGGRESGLARAYTIAIAVMLALAIATLVRLRRTRQGPLPYRSPGTLRIRGRELPAGLSSRLAF